MSCLGVDTAYSCCPCSPFTNTSRPLCAATSSAPWTGEFSRCAFKKKLYQFFNLLLSLTKLDIPVHNTIVKKPSIILGGTDRYTHCSLYVIKQLYYLHSENEK